MTMYFIWQSSTSHNGPMAVAEVTCSCNDYEQHFIATPEKMENMVEQNGQLLVCCPYCKVAGEPLEH